MSIQINGNYGYTPQTYAKHTKSSGRSFAETLRATDTSVKTSVIDEQYKALRESHDINGIKPNSPEYDALVDDLVKKGIIPDVPFFPIKVGEWGKERKEGFFVFKDSLPESNIANPQNLNLLDWLADYLREFEEIYLALLGNNNLSDQEKLRLQTHEAQRDFFNVLKEIGGNK